MVRARSTRALALVAGVLAACGGGAREAPRAFVPNEPSPPPYKLVVAIVVDQLAAWEMESRLPLLPPGGGFSRLAREGAYYTHASYEHATTDTAPGHAALYTGLPAGKSGVFANEVVLPDGAVGSVYRDASTHAIGGPPDISSSGKRLKAKTVADTFRAKYPRAKIVSLSLKDRGAIPGGGQTPTLSLWLDTKRGAMVTSTAFARALPPWLVGKNAIDRATYAIPWTMLNPEWVKTHAATKDGAPGEGDMAGLGTEFPHPVTAGDAFGLAFRTTPYGDAYLLQLARDAIENERLGEGPSLLALSLSSHDYIGHVFGPDSWESWDELYRLDAELAKFFSYLDQRFGRDGYAVLLSADHGIGSLPEMRQEPTDAPPPESDEVARRVGSNRRFLPNDLRTSLDAELRREFESSEPLVLGIAEPYVRLTEKGIGYLADPTRRSAFAHALNVWAQAQGSLEVIPMDVCKAICASLASPPASGRGRGEGLAQYALVCNSVDPQGGELYLRTRQGAIIDTGYVPGRGTNHGTEAFYDREVPFFARAPKTWEGGKRTSEPTPISVFARSLRAVLAVSP